MKNLFKLTIAILIITTLLTSCAKTQPQEANNNLSSNHTASIKEDTTTTNTLAKTEEKEEASNTSSKPAEKKAETKIQTKTTSVTKTEVKKEEIPRPLKTLEEEVITLLNAEREKAGLKPLITDDTYYNYVLTRTKECEKEWSHTRPNGEQWSSLYINDSSIKDIRLLGENLGKQFSNAEIIVKALMDSEPHRKNILHQKFTHVCVAITEMQLQEKENKTLYVMAQHFYFKEEK